jgi:hypothetical protein
MNNERDAEAIEQDGVVDGFKGSRQIEQCKYSRVTTIVREDLSNGELKGVTSPKAGLVRREKLVKGKITMQFLGNETF